jgi:hypothetical protein
MISGQTITLIINKLIRVTQYLLKFAWERVKLESRYGILSESMKDKLQKKYIDLYLEESNENKIIDDIEGDISSPQQYKARIQQQNPGNQTNQITDLFGQYNY